MSTITYKLQKPIQAHGEEVSELTLRHPTVQECRNIKVMPYTLGADNIPVLENEAAGKYLAICAAIPASSVNQLSLPDFNSLAWAIVGFFVSRASEASPESSS